MNNQSQIEIQMVFGQYDKTLIDGFCKDLSALAEKWQLQTKSTCFSIKEQKKKRIKRLDATELRRSSRLAAKQHNL